MDDVTKVINKIGDKMKVMRWLGYSIDIDSEKSHAYADYYVHIYPLASWKHLTKTLCEEGEWTAAKESKSHMSTGKHC